MIVSESCEVDNKINNVLCYMEDLKSYVGVPLLNYNSRCLMHAQICMYHAAEMYDCICQIFMHAIIVLRNTIIAVSAMYNNIHSPVEVKGTCYFSNLCMSRFIAKAVKTLIFIVYFA